MNKADFSKHTEKIRAALPFWFQMKKKPNNSVGLDFLNIFGMQLDDIEKMLDYASKQYFIDTADLNSADVVYKVHLPSHYSMDLVNGVFSGSGPLSVVGSLYKFFGIEDRINNITNAYDQNNICFLDKDNKTVFVREPYGKSKDLPYGRIYILYEDRIKEFELNIHHVWNFFDEFGALVGCQRLKGEKNFQYKRRILDVFKNPANSTKKGLANGIGRELDLRAFRLWDDMSQDFIIKDRMVIVDSISVNGEEVHPTFVTDEGYIAIKGNKLWNGMRGRISYLRSFSIEPLVEKNTNTALSNELFYSDGTPTDTMLRYIEKIKSEASIMWGDFTYNEALWIKDKEDYYSNHFSFTPTRLDAKIGGFEKYGFVK